MSKFIIVSMRDEATAYEGTRSIDTLDEAGAISVYGMAVIKKDGTGAISVLKQDSEGPTGTLVGTLIGGFIGLIAGPIGVVLGMGGGAIAGLATDAENLGLSANVFDTVARDLAPGTVAIVAEISEEWETPLDTQMAALGSVMYRFPRYEVEDELESAQIAAETAELDRLKVDFSEAKADKKASLQMKIDAVKTKISDRTEKLRASIARAKVDATAKMHDLDAKVAKATGEAKDKIEARKVAVHAANEKQSAHLHHAWELLNTPI